MARRAPVGVPLRRLRTGGQRRRQPRREEAIAPGEVLRDMADRKVREQVGPEIHLNMSLQGSGAPVAMHWEPVKEDEFYGEKTFFFKAHLHARAGEPYPQVQLRSRKDGKKSKSSYMWLTREECAALFRKQEEVLAKKGALPPNGGVPLSSLVERLLH